MPDDYTVKKKKLSFKGESNKTKKKKRKAEDETKEEEDSGNADGWVSVKTLSDIGGPIFLTFSSDPPSCLAIDDKGKVTMKLLESLDESQPTNAVVVFENAEPTTVNQVFVATMIPDSDRLTLKSYNGRYLSSDKFGIVTADSEAIGMQEEWTAIVKSEDEGGICLQNHYGKFLSVDEVAAVEGRKGASFQIRADSDVIGFCELFQAKIQAKYRKKVKKSNEVKIATKDYELEQNRKFQTWNHGRVIVSTEGMSDLKKAQKEGRFSEALLDRREKLKSDRYCK
ncbi:FRG1-like family-domain-containing protein [Dissophora ornata]|nr:FRG1-like family-domain-containing protein [Dissophora ornata]